MFLDNYIVPNHRFKILKASLSKRDLNPDEDKKGDWI